MHVYWFWDKSGICVKAIDYNKCSEYRTTPKICGVTASNGYEKAVFPALIFWGLSNIV